MPISLSIEDSKGETKALAIHDSHACLAYNSRYKDGDKIRVSSEKPALVIIQLEETAPPAFGYLKGSFAFPIPFGAEKATYSPKSFAGNAHRIWAKTAQPHEANRLKNLALNPYDSHGNATFFPHAQANVETRGEAQFAARNAINGNASPGAHGNWPYESWGIGKRDDAELVISFGRPVYISELVVTIRSDFPHDNWWKEVTFSFSDESSETVSLAKTGAPQAFSIEPRVTEWVSFNTLIKDESDPSPFPALLQLEAWGTEPPKDLPEEPKEQKE